MSPLYPCSNAYNWKKRRIRLNCWIHSLPNDLKKKKKKNPVRKAEAHRSGWADGIVHSVKRKVISFLLYSKGRKLASFQVGYPDWSSLWHRALLFPWDRFGTSSLKSVVSTRASLHTHHTGHMIHVSHPLWLRRSRAGGEERVWETWKFFPGKSISKTSVCLASSCCVSYSCSQQWVIRFHKLIRACQQCAERCAICLGPSPW